ncbi:glutaminase A [Pseudanabaena biceps]|nr:glutaminase A [Pseudanabaena biceps]
MLENNLQQWLKLAQIESAKGKLPSYIPLLANANPQTIAIAILGNNQIAGGDIHLQFPLMSVVKPFLLLYLLETLGSDLVFKLVDRQASDLPFNVIPQGKPPNPMLNCGAIAIASLLDSYISLQIWLNQRSGANLTLDLAMLESVRSVNNRRNLAIAAQLQNLGLIANPDQALATYEEICCLRGNVEDLAKIGTLLISSNINQSLAKQHSLVLEIMAKCGIYESSAKFAQDIGLPAKSSISGALLAIMPHQAIACYSPALDAIGNSVAGLFLIQKIKNQAP